MKLLLLAVKTVYRGFLPSKTIRCDVRCDMMSDRKEMIRWRKRKGLFAIIDYETPKGIRTAKGEVEDVTSSGIVLIRHLKKPDFTWDIRIEQIKNSSVEKIKGGKSA